jgi:uncharacterized protein (TIGR02444 family)
VTPLPETAFWRFSVQLYARPGVADACIALQDRETADVNLVLLALWLGGRGHRLDAVEGQVLADIAQSWQRPVVAPLRDVRRHLKRSPPAAWTEAIAAWRCRLSEVELAMEQVEQLLLEKAVGAIRPGPGGLATTSANLAVLGMGRLVETAELALLLRAVDALDMAPP